jgi:hypothetical protein
MHHADTRQNEERGVTWRWSRGHTARVATEENHLRHRAISPDLGVRPLVLRPRITPGVLLSGSQFFGAAASGGKLRAVCNEKCQGRRTADLAISGVIEAGYRGGR